MPRRLPEPLRNPTWLCATLALGLGSASCADTSTLPTTIVHPTLIEVWPNQFLGTVPCLDAPGAMRSYVATVYDLGPTRVDETGQVVDEFGEPVDPSSVRPAFALPSSGPVACTQPVGFGQVTPGNSYRAEIFGYDRPNLVRLAPGVPIMVDAETGERVEPRWTTRCGDEEPTICHAQFARTIQGCHALVDSMPSDLTSVEVRIDSVLGPLGCGEEAGQISRFEVEVAQGERVSAACGESVVIDVVNAGTALLLPVFAFEAGADEAGWGTTCTATPASGATVQASCTTLTDRGGVDVSPLAVLEAMGLDCSALGELTLVPKLPADQQPASPTSAKDPRTVTASGCNSNVRFGGIPRGLFELDATLVDSNGASLGASVCSAEVIPNQAVPSACSVVEP
jgi:hypothetical protein